MISTLTVEDLERLIESSVSKALASARECEALLPTNRLAYTEQEAASLLGVNYHVLRDARIRGDIVATKVGSRHAYTHADLLTYLEGNKA